MIDGHEVTLCIINFNGASYLRHALAAIKLFSRQFDEILIIDNASTDDSVAYARSVEGVNVVPLSRNYGPGGGRNIGFKLARHDCILFQDNDIRLRSDTAVKLLHAISGSENVLVAAPRVLYHDRPGIIQYDSADCHLLGMMSLRHANRLNTDVSPETSVTTSLVTACFMIQRNRWDGHGGQLFDDRLVFNLEDHDFGVRANLLGHDTVVVPDACVTHGAGTDGLSWRPGYEISSIRMFCLIRNRWWIILRYFSWGTLFRLAPALVIFECLQLAGAFYKGFWREWMKAFGSTLQQLPLLLRQRWHYQRIRRKTDKQILRVGPLPLTAAMASNPWVARLIMRFEATLARYQD